MRDVVLQNQAATLWWRSEGFWHFRMEAFYEISAAEVEEFFDALEARSSGRRSPLLLDRSNPYSPQFGAWQMLVERAPQAVSAIAYYAPTPAATMAAEFTAEVILKGWGAVRVFQREAAAVAWLLEWVERDGAGDETSPPDTGGA